VLTTLSPANDGDGSLRANVAAAQPGDTIDFDPSLDGALIRLTSPIQLARPLTITGTNQSTGVAEAILLDGSNRTRLFDIAPGAAVTLAGLTLQDGFARATAAEPGDGGAVRDRGALSLQGDFFQGNRADDSGGAIDVSRTSSASLTDLGSVFRYNRAVNGSGGAVSTSDATPSAGDLALSFTDTTFTGNAAGQGGGALDFFTPPGAAGNFSLAVLGATTFTDNAAGNGGAVGASVSAAGDSAVSVQFDLLGSYGRGTFVNNHATAPITQDPLSGAPLLSGYGGALDGNWALSDNARATVSVVGGTWSYNWADLGGALAVRLRTAGRSSGSVLIDRVSASHNEAVWGGGVYAEAGGGNVTVSDSTLDDNLAKSYQTPDAAPLVLDAQGGGLYGAVTAAAADGAPLLSCANDTVAFNAAVESTPRPSQGNGGGLFFAVTGGGAAAATSVSLDSLTVAYNLADDSGGGLASSGAGGFPGPAVLNCVFDSNLAGAALPIQDVSGPLTDQGFNTASSPASTFTVEPPAVIKLDTALRNNGGLTPTLMPLPFSSLIRTGGTALFQDQRGYHRGAMPTRGAVEPAGPVAYDSGADLAIALLRDG
jgi:hypothetical protein